MHRGGGRSRGIGALAVALLIAVLTGCGPYPQPRAEKDCAREVLSDWSDGGIDGVYDDRCYVAAIDALPEDLRAYTSAGDDIARALRSRRAPTDVSASDARHLAESPVTDAGQAGKAGLENLPLPVVLLGGLVIALAAAGLVPFALRRLRRSS